MSYDILRLEAMARGRLRSWLARAACVTAICSLGTCLRLLGIRFGLPYHHHWDEGWIVDSVTAMLRHGDDVPASYQYGAPMMRLTVLAFLGVRRLEGLPPSLGPGDEQITLYVFARAVSALVSSTGIVATYLAARQARTEGKSDATTALAAALLYAVSSELVMHARYAVTDACLVSLTAWTLAFTGKYLKGGALRWGVLSVLAAGTTCAFKVPGIMTCLIPLLAVGQFAFRRSSCQRRHVRLLLAFIPLVAGTYVFLNPHVIDRYHDAMGDLIGRYKQTRDGGFSSVYVRDRGLSHLGSALWAIITELPSRNVWVSMMVSTLSLGGLVQGVRRRNPLMTIAALYVIGLVLSVAVPNRTFLVRNYLVVMPGLCLGFGVGLSRLERTIRLRFLAAKRTRTFGSAAVAACVLVFLVYVPAGDALMAQSLQADARMRALGWVSHQSGAGATLDVGLTPSVFGKSALGAYPALASTPEPPHLRFVSADVSACPEPPGPQYVIDASYRETHLAPHDDPYAEQWLFQRCAGYEEVARFVANPYEANVEAYPTWNGRVSALVLRRVGPGSF